MKIAVSARGSELSSQVDPRFGRAAYLIIYNTDDESFEGISNESAAGATQGAGIQAAQAVANKKADWVVSGNIGPKAFTALKAANIKITSWSEGTVEEAIKLLVSGKLQEITQANVQGHWQ